MIKNLLLRIAYSVLAFFGRWPLAASRWPFIPHPSSLIPHPRFLSELITLIPLLLLLLTACGRSAPPAPSFTTLNGTLPITAPETATVGDTIELTVGPMEALDGTPIQLTLLTSYGPHLLRAEFQNNQAWFQIPSQMTTRSGKVILTAVSGNAQGKHTLELLPDEPVEPLIPLVGARSIIADGDHYAMAVVVPFDQYGNPIAEGTPVEMRSLHPGNSLIEYNPEIEHLLAWERIYSQTKAGRTVITANIGDVYGPENILLEIAGWPVPFTITADPPTLPADGFQLMTLRTDTIRDRFGNVLPDGTQLTFIMTGADGRTRSMPTQIVDGIAETFMQTPLIPGQYQIQATMLGMESQPLTVEFTPGPAIGRFPVKLTLDTEAGAVLITAGPIIGTLEQFVPNGTPVTFELTDNNGQRQTLTVNTTAGYATAELRRTQLTSGRYTITATAGAGSGRLTVEFP